MARILDRRRVLSGIASGLLVIGGGAALAAFDEIDLAKVPATIKEAATKVLPKARWSGAEKSEEGGKVTYEMQGQDASKRYVWVELTADGKVLEEGSQIASDKVPPVVAAALKKKMPQFKVASSYEARADGKVIRYDFEGKRPKDKEEITVNVSPDGKKVEIEED